MIAVQVNELESRDCDGISVTLLHEVSSNQCMIELETDSEWMRFSVPNDCALDAFAHPYCYAPQSFECDEIPGVYSRKS